MTSGRSSQSIRLPAQDLARLAASLFAAAGMEADKADCMGRLLLLTDMMGRHTHGLAQCAAYLREIESGGMTTAGDPEVIRDTGPTVVWDGRYLPGLWLMDEALELALGRVAQHGAVTFAMRRSHHIGCLAALAKTATDAGCYAMLASSGPHTRVVAPFGGKEGLFSPNPFAIGFPTTAFPVLVDTSASITTVSMTRQKAAAGELFEHPWLMDSAGRPTRDPAVMERATDRGSLLLLGGAEAGHKGFGLALMVEALTQGLSGHGRLDAPTVGRQRLHAGHRPGGVCGPTSLHRPDGFLRRSLPRQCAHRSGPPRAPAGRTGQPQHRRGRRQGGARFARNGDGASHMGRPPGRQHAAALRSSPVGLAPASGLNSGTTGRTRE
jgi:LDH2 family malate/lactate/ureidoglycolate dehydrogenase